VGVFENRVLSRIFGPKRNEYIMKSFITYTFQYNENDQLDRDDTDMANNTNWGRVMHTGYWSKS
jgi:hypothetical protein